MQLAFPSPAAAGWGNATYLAMLMKLAYEDWATVRDVINHDWSAQASAAAAATAVGIRAPRAFVSPRFIQGSSFHFMTPAGVWVEQVGEREVS